MIYNFLKIIPLLTYLTYAFRIKVLVFNIIFILIMDNEWKIDNFLNFIKKSLFFILKYVI